MPTPTFKLIEEKEVTASGGNSTITFTSIPSTYNDLHLYISCRSTTTAAFINIRARFNGATSDTDHKGLLRWSDGTGNNMGRYDYAYVGDFTGGTIDGTSNFSGGWLYIPDYAGSNKKIGYAGSVGLNLSTSSTYIENGTVFWNSTSAINQIELVISAGNYAQHSKFQLFGIKNS